MNTLYIMHIQPLLNPFIDIIFISLLLFLAMFNIFLFFFTNISDDFPILNQTFSGGEVGSMLSIFFRLQTV